MSRVLACNLSWISVSFNIGLMASRIQRPIPAMSVIVQKKMNADIPITIRTVTRIVLYALYLLWHKYWKQDLS